MTILDPPSEPPARQPVNQDINNQFAVYIVGCLVHAGFIDFDVATSEDQQAEIVLAARVIKACLDQLTDQPLNYPSLPFEW